MDKKNLKTRIMRASGKGCVAAVFAERSSMACVPAFMESCEAAVFVVQILFFCHDVLVYSCSGKRLS